MADLTIESCIPRHLHSRRLRILAGAALIADTRNAVEPLDHGYSPMQYLSRSNLDMSKTLVSLTVIRCPFKDDFSHYSLTDSSDLAWSYERLLKGA